MVFWLLWLGLLAAAAAATPADSLGGDTRPPHIILIIADDLGWNDVGVHGSELVPTPNIDALAASGRLLRRHYAMPTCTPSRSALLTGKHPVTTGMQGFPLKAGEPRGLPLGEETLAQRLRARGYATHLVGKWHLGSHRTPFLPTHRGFDTHFGYRNGYVGYFDHRIEQHVVDGKVLTGLDLWRDLWPAPETRAAAEDGYLTSAFTEEAVRRVCAHNASQPLFLQLAHLAVHSGNDSLVFEVPDPQAAHRRFAYEPDAERRLYAEMVSRLDASVGAVVGALRDCGLLNDSLVAFVSDNGGMTVGLHYNTGSNWPLRGTKHTLFEGGVHTVGAVWSRRLQAPRTPYLPLLHMMDWAPTLLAAAGDVPDAPADDHLAGVSHWHAIVGPADEGETPPPRDSVLLNIDDVLNHSAILSGHWKYVEGSHENGSYDGFEGSSARGAPYPSYDAAAVAHTARVLQLDPSLTDGDVRRVRAAAAISCHGLQDTLGSPPCSGGCLFDLDVDPCETRDVSAARPDVRRQLRARLARLRGRAVPQLNQPVDPQSDPALHGGAWEPWLDDEPVAASQARLPADAAEAHSVEL